MTRWIAGGLMMAGLAAVAIHAQDKNPASQMQMMQACPMKAEGTTVAAADTANGIAVTFTAKPENVKDLQGRVERMANMHNAMSSGSGTQMHMIAGTVKYDALPTGARLTFTPQDSSKLKEFREQVRSRVEQMKKGDCSMMQDMMMQGMMMQSGSMRGMDHAAETPKAKGK